MTGFNGLPVEAFTFYEGLQADNSRTYWEQHREVYDACVKHPLAALLAELEPEFGRARIFRPYRDVRFSKDKSPYKTSASASVGDGSAASGVLYLQLSATGLKIAGGAYTLSTAQARQLRGSIASEPGEHLVPVLDRLEAEGFTNRGQRLLRLPKAFPADHPRADLLRLKTLVAVREHPPQEWMHTARAADRIANSWRALAPLTSWLARHVAHHQAPAQ